MSDVERIAELENTVANLEEQVSKNLKDLDGTNGCMADLSRRADAQLRMIEAQQVEIAALKAEQEAHARSLHELWHCIRTGSQGDL